jgi:diaminohydroxyphosphoribosylaminopyrimidine deaminase/5-amino-6-(5-phosphoribosylamino)uracil reductase
LETLFKLNIQSVIIEGGAYTLNSFLKENLWDEIRLFQSTTKLEEGISAPEINLIPQNKEQLGEDQLFIYYAY